MPIRSPSGYSRSTSPSPESPSIPSQVLQSTWSMASSWPASFCCSTTACQAAGPLKAVSFACLAWFFRVVMYAASQWVMFNVPAQALLYSMGAGLSEMAGLGVFYRLTLRGV